MSAPSASAPAAVHEWEQSTLAPRSPSRGGASVHELKRGEREIAKFSATRAIAQFSVECIAKDVVIVTACIAEAQDESPRELLEEAGKQEVRCSSRTLSSARLPVRRLRAMTPCHLSRSPRPRSRSQ